MSRFHFHLGTLLILILVLGVGIAALRESNETWDGSTFSITLAVLLISILLAIHHTEKRRAFWLGFTLFGWIYLGLSLVLSIESRLITTKTLTFLDSKMPRSIPASVALYDLFVNNNSQPNALYLNKGNGDFQDVTAAAGLNTQVTGSGRLFLNNSGPWLRGSNGTTENFIRIGHSLFALIVAFLGGHLSRHLYAKNLESVPGPANPVGPISNGSGG